MCLLSLFSNSDLIETFLDLHVTFFKCITSYYLDGTVPLIPIIELLTIKANNVPILFFNDTISSKVQWTFCFLCCFAWHAMSINHRRSHIRMSKHCLDRTNIIICLQKVCGKAVPKSMRFDALGKLCMSYCFFQCFLKLRFMQMIPL